jgi:hypothetical protein
VREPLSIYESNILTDSDYISDSASKQALLSWISGVSAVASAENSMDVDSKPSTPEPVPEVEVYFRLLLIHHLLTSSMNYPKALELAQQTVEKVQQLNRRSMDPIAAKVWFAVERAYELGGELADARPYVTSCCYNRFGTHYHMFVECSSRLNGLHLFVTTTILKHP